MIRFLYRLVAMLFLLGCAGCATLGQRLPPAPTLEEVVQMARDKIAAEEIIARMDAARAVYRLSGSDFARLREQGVPDRVLDHMLSRQLQRARYEEWLRSRDYVYFGPYWYRPYPYWPYPWGMRAPYLWR